MTNLNVIKNFNFFFIKASNFFCIKNIVSGLCFSLFVVFFYILFNVFGFVKKPYPQKQKNLNKKLFCVGANCTFFLYFLYKKIRSTQAPQQTKPNHFPKTTQKPPKKEVLYYFLIIFNPISTISMVYFYKQKSPIQNFEKNSSQPQKISDANRAEQQALLQQNPIIPDEIKAQIQN